MEEVRSPRVHSQHLIRVQNTVYQKAAFIKPMPNFIKITHRSFPGDVRSDQNPARAGCFRTGPDNSEFRIKLFSGSKKGGGSSSGIQPETTQQVRAHGKVSFGKYVQSSRFSSTSGLAREIRSSQRILSHTGKRDTPKVPENCNSTQTLANDLPAFRPLNSAEGFLVNNELDSRGTPVTRYTGSRIPGRFSPSMPESYSSGGTGKSHTSYFEGSGLDHKSREILSATTAYYGVSGNPLGSMEQHKISATRKDPEHPAEVPHHAIEKGNIVKANSIPSRVMQLRELRCSERPPQQQTVVSLQQPDSKYAPEYQGKTAFISCSQPRMVDGSRTPINSYSPSGSRILSYDRRVGQGLGRPAQRHEASGSVVVSGVKRALQLPGADGCKKGSKLFSSNNGPFRLNDYVRQPDRCIISTKRGGDQSAADDERNIRYPRYFRSLSYTHDSTIHSRPIQRRSRSSLEIPKPVGMAFASLCNRNDFPAVGYSGNRLICVTESSRSPSVRFSRPHRPACRIRECVQSEMDLSVGVDFPPAVPDTARADSPQQSHRYVSGGCTQLGEGVLAERPKEPSAGSSIRDPEPPNQVGRCPDPTASPGCQADGFGSLADTGWATLIDSWDDRQRSLLASGWRKSTISSYKPAWARWHRWCVTNNVNKNSPAPQDLAKFLTDLHLIEKLAYSTICLHKSVVSTFCPVSSGPPLSSHVIVRQALKAISLGRPSSSKAPIWDIKDLCKYLQDHMPDNTSLYEVSKRCAILLLLCSGRRVHDLTLLNLSRSKCVIQPDSVIFWPDFGSKTDNATNRQSGWKLLHYPPNVNIDPVYWIKKLIFLSQTRRGDINKLFISTCGIVKPASRTMIGGWIRSVLKDAGIDSSAGSVRSAVASSSWLDNDNIENILIRGNWKSASTFHKFYKKSINTRYLNSNSLDECFQSL